MIEEYDEQHCIEQASLLKEEINGENRHYRARIKIIKSSSK